MGWKWGRALAVVVVLAPAAPPAGAAEPRLYEVDAVAADWTVWKRDDRFHLWTIEAARYRDLASGEVETYARVMRLACEGSADEMSCADKGGPGTAAAGVPEVFEFEDDLSGAAVTLGRYRAEWTAYGPTEDAFASLVPYPYIRAEACVEGSGNGYGAFREMRAEGTLFGRRPAAPATFAAMGRYVLETECDPAAWWNGGRALPIPQWLRRAETSSFLSIPERPSMPTSFAFS